jgi:hypothetical protein
MDRLLNFCFMISFGSSLPNSKKTDIWHHLIIAWTLCFGLTRMQILLGYRSCIMSERTTTFAPKSHELW